MDCFKKRVNNEIKDIVFKMWVHQNAVCSCSPPYTFWRE